LPTAQLSSCGLSPLFLTKSSFLSPSKHSDPGCSSSDENITKNAPFDGPFLPDSTQFPLRMDLPRLWDGFIFDGTAGQFQGLIQKHTGE
jgi:hypothetical protein